MTAGEEGGPITAAQAGALVAIAVMAGVVPALQPMLLAGLMKAGKLSATSLGLAATVEALGMAAASILSTFCLKPRRLRLLASLSILASVVSTALTLALHDEAIVLARGLSGMANGVLLWILVGMLTRVAQPARMFALYVTGQALCAFLLSSLFAAFLLPRHGAAGAYATLASLNVALLILAVPFIPRAYQERASDGARMRLPSGWGWIALLGVAGQMAGIMAFWVYLVPIAQQAGISAAQANGMISIAIGAQILGGLAACFAASRWRETHVLAGTAGAALLVLIITSLSSSPGVWSAALFLFLFCWMFAPPFHIAFLLKADSSGSAAMLISPAQLLGMAIGPMIGAAFVARTGFEGARTMSACAFAWVIVCALIIHMVAASRRAVA